jgi:hypothetical protein
VVSDFEEIPILPLVLGEDYDYMLSKLSPIQGLADLNISHYQLETDLNSVLSLCMTPILLTTGGAIKSHSGRQVSENTTLLSDNVTSNINSYSNMVDGHRLTASASTVISTDKSKTEVDAKYVQPSAESIELAFTQLKEFQAGMRNYGVDIAAPDKDILATTKIIDNENINNVIKGHISEVTNLLYKISDLYMNFYNKEYTGEVIVDYNFGEKELTSEQKDIIKMLYDTGALADEFIYTSILQPRFPTLKNVEWDEAKASTNGNELPNTVATDLTAIFNPS